MRFRSSGAVVGIHSIRSLLGWRWLEPYLQLWWAQASTDAGRADTRALSFASKSRSLQGAVFEIGIGEGRPFGSTSLSSSSSSLDRTLIVDPAWLRVTRESHRELSRPGTRHEATGHRKTTGKSGSNMVDKLLGAV
ncbi:hypothetical protein MKZ38_003463 [Zalerion maritima]|uniref:Uncharacterized protein n=1 Tax=Zalerion maritima TaxID=339359 RepID=A0AAD5RYC6_9PEZI|nr:hypothetical protein MKZ38_003463 [Zalerion maritima]